MRSQNDRYERWLGGAFVDVDVDGARIDPQYRRPECRFFCRLCLRCSLPRPHLQKIKHLRV